MCLSSLHLQGDVWICMELLDSSMDKISERVYHQLHSAIPEKILGKMSVAVRYQILIMSMFYHVLVIYWYYTPLVY